MRREIGRKLEMDVGVACVLSLGRVSPLLGQRSLARIRTEMLGVVYLGSWGEMSGSLRWARRRRGRVMTAVGVAAAGMAMTGAPGLIRKAEAEVCTTQSAMQPADRIALAQAARELAGRMQAGDAAGLEAETIPELTKDFSGIRGAVAELAPHLKGDTLVVDQVYLLDATTLGAEVRHSSSAR